MDETKMNRRNFFKGLCALAVAPLAAALPMSKPRTAVPHKPSRPLPAYSGQQLLMYGWKPTTLLAPLTEQGKARLVLDWSRHRLREALQNPETVKQLAGYGYKVDYKALARMFNEVAL
jgi:hypothetical protein